MHGFDLSNAGLSKKSVPLYPFIGECPNFKTGDYFSLKSIFQAESQEIMRICEFSTLPMLI